MCRLNSIRRLLTSCPSSRAPPRPRGPNETKPARTGHSQSRALIITSPATVLLAAQAGGRRTTRQESRISLLASGSDRKPLPGQIIPPARGDESDGGGENLDSLRIDSRKSVHVS